MVSPHLNTSGLDFTPPTSLLAAGAASTVVVGASTNAFMSMLSRIPVWLWLIIVGILSYGAYRLWKRREDKAAAALRIAEENRRRLDDHDDPFGGMDTKA